MVYLKEVDKYVSAEDFISILLAYKNGGEVIRTSCYINDKLLNINNLIQALK